MSSFTVFIIIQLQRFDRAVGSPAPLITCNSALKKPRLFKIIAERIVHANFRLVAYVVGYGRNRYAGGSSIALPTT